MNEQEQFCSTTSPHQVKLTQHTKAGGCAAKISPSQLAEIVRGLPEFTDPNLLTTISSFEDAAVYKISDELAIVQTVDFFPPVVDDPYLFGRIAAVNAISDIYAMGAKPIIALGLLCFPVCDFPLSVAQEIMKGGADALKEAGAALVGGHSIQSIEPIYGLAVSGIIHPQQILTNGGAKPGDALVLTKRLGSGVLLLAHKASLLNDATLQTLLDSLTLLNRSALDIALQFKPHAATDITGFGLIGHIHEMCKASGLQGNLRASSVPFLPEALSFAEQGFVPAGAYANRKAYNAIAELDDALDVAIADLLFDPQTSGGLLLALEPAKAKELVRLLTNAGLTGAIIGYMSDGISGHIKVHAQ